MARAEEPARPWLVLTGLALGVTATNGFARFAYGLILPAMQAELGWTYAQAGWLNTANALGYIGGAAVTMLAIRRISPARLFIAGLVTTAFCLLLTGASAALWWQTGLRALAGFCGALSFATAGTLAARLFAGDPRRSALAIAILFGSGGGFAIVLAGASIPPMLAVWGDAAWPWGWTSVGAVSLAVTPLGVWAARQLRPPPQTLAPVPLPLGVMLPEIAGYAGFGLGYIVYLTFLSAWMVAQQAGPGLVSAVWVLLGTCICVSPFLWRGIFARYDAGQPLAMILTCIALGSALPVLVPTTAGLVASALVFGLSVFMSPGAVTNFAQKNLPAESVGAAISFFTVVFAVAQTIGPYAAGLIGDATGSIGTALIAAAGILLLGAGAAMIQRPLR
jgi:predicted MFS family arabinose efflux permease